MRSTVITPLSPVLPLAWGLSTDPCLVGWAEDVTASNYWFLPCSLPADLSACMLLQALQSKTAGLA